jgi:hypothetical protein
MRRHPKARVESHKYGTSRGGNHQYVRRTQDTVNDGLRSSLEVIGAVIAPITVLTALDLYLRWRRTASYAQYFGIDQSVL